jgi:type I restriction enzyme S subunit
MSSVDDLIAGHSLNGVALRPLGEVGKLVRGNGLQKKDLRDEGIGAIHYGQIYTTYGTATTTTKSFVEPVLAARLKRARPGDLVIATTSENDEDVCKAVAWLGDEEIAVSGDAFIYAHDLDPQYVAYFFQTEAFRAQKRRFISGTKVKRVSGADLARIKIPVPPLATQRAIALSLGKMESLKAELEAELEAELDYRSRQYSFYRDSLLTFAEGEGIRWAILGDVATFKYGYTASAAPTGEYRFIRITDIDARGKLRPNEARYVGASDDAAQYLVKRGDLLMARTGATYGKTVLVEDEVDAVYASFLIRIRLDEAVVHPAYYWHFAQSGLYWDQANALVSTGGQPQFNANVLKTIKLPVPPLDEQQRIIAILDKFDALVNDLSISLPAEIEARRKQYEYYRDKLLTFEEAA